MIRRPSFKFQLKSFIYSSNIHYIQGIMPGASNTEMTRGERQTVKMQCAKCYRKNHYQRALELQRKEQVGLFEKM